jgi:hypothetical protein
VAAARLVFWPEADPRLCVRLLLKMRENGAFPTRG